MLIRIFVFVADLRRHFVSPPIATSVELYGQTSLRCLGPAGAPLPTLTWLKNGVPILPGSSSTVLLSAEGHLLVSQATLQVRILIRLTQLVECFYHRIKKNTRNAICAYFVIQKCNNRVLNFQYKNVSSSL